MTQLLETFFKKWSFNFPLNMDSVKIILIERGRTFHNLGATLAKARFPFFFKVDLGTVNNIWLDDLKHLADMLKATSSDK